MPNQDDILREQTFKGDATEVGRRVYYTITNQTPPSPNEPHERVARGFSQLMEILHANDSISDDDVDNILLKMVGY
jgi:hypothetical protein